MSDDGIKTLETVAARVVKPMDRRIAALEKRITQLEQRGTLHRLRRWIGTLLTRRTTA